jgi:hypothetical protein
MSALLMADTGEARVESAAPDDIMLGQSTATLTMTMLPGITLVEQPYHPPFSKRHMRRHH